MTVWKTLTRGPQLLWQLLRYMRQSRKARRRAQHWFSEEAASVGVPPDKAEKLAESYPEIISESTTNLWE